MDLQKALELMAADRGADAAELRTQLEAAIHKAYSSDDAAVKEWFASRFGDREPTLEELVASVRDQFKAALEEQAGLHIKTARTPL